MPVSTYVFINSDNGNMYVLRSFHNEQLRNFHILVQAQDSGFPPLSNNVIVNVFILDQNTRCLVVSLGAISFTFLVAIIVLAAIKGYRDRHSIRRYNFSLSACCRFRSEESTTDVFKKSNLNVHITTGTKGSTNCVEANGNGPLSQPYCYKMCLTPESSKSDFMFLKSCSPMNATPQKNNAKGADYPKSGWSAQDSRSLIVNNGPTIPNEVNGLGLYCSKCNHIRPPNN